MRFFSYDPKTDTWINRESLGQWNTVVRQGDRFFVGAYIQGMLLEWDPASPWISTQKGTPGCNPLFLTECEPTINRPHDLLAHPDGKTIVMAGTPGYGYTGGGLLFWDRETRTATLLEHTAILPQHSTMSLVALPGGKLLGGTTTAPGTGGEQKASEAELYVMDMATKRVEWHQAVLPGMLDYTDLCLGSDGLIYGIANAKWFFVFDPVRRELVHREDAEPRFGLTGYQQGQRKFLLDSDGTLYVLFSKGVARVGVSPFNLTMVFESPVPMRVGGDILDGRMYFSSGSHLYSVGIPGQ
jgi:hypothetical protein